MESGPPPAVDLAREQSNGNFVRSVIGEERCLACHDISDGGLIIALAEMAVAGQIGIELTDCWGADSFWPFLFGEDQARYILEIDAAAGERLEKDASETGICIRHIGLTGGNHLVLPGITPISLERMSAAKEDWLPSLMAS